MSIAHRSFMTSCLAKYDEDPSRKENIAKFYDAWMLAFVARQRIDKAQLNMQEVARRDALWKRFINNASSSQVSSVLSQQIGKDKNEINSVLALLTTDEELEIFSDIVDVSKYEGCIGVGVE